MMPQPVHTSASIRIIVIDDHALIREGLRLLLERRPGLIVVGEAANRAEALALAAREQPDIILLDLDLGSENGIDFLPELFSAAAAARVIVLTGVRDPELHQRAVRLGALGIVLKEQAGEVLLKAIEKVQAGEVWLDRTMIATILTTLVRPQAPEPVDPEALHVASLTAREREIITLIGQGFNNGQIAGRLAISKATVNHHLTSIFAKLKVSSRLELVVYLYRHDLVKQSR
jgi:two-component system nitrate/nitrite response regulator NarL